MNRPPNRFEFPEMTRFALIFNLTRRGNHRLSVEQGLADDMLCNLYLGLLIHRKRSPFSTEKAWLVAISTADGE